MRFYKIQLTPLRLLSNENAKGYMAKTVFFITRAVPIHQIQLIATT